jgi:hypothetical protein
MAGGTGNSFAVAKSQIGLALETTKGTLPSAPQYMIPIKGPKYKPNLTFIPDDTLQGSMVEVYDMIPGLRYDSHGWDGFPYLDSFPLFVMGELGSTDTMTTASASTTLSSAAVAGALTIDVTAAVTAGTYIVIGSGATIETHLVASIATLVVTLATPLLYNQASGAAVTGLTSHKFSVANSPNTSGDQPPSLSLWDFDGDQWRTISAGQIDELTIKGNATGLASYTVTFFGNPAKTNAAAPSVSYTATETPPPWTVTILVGGTQLQTVVDWEFTFKRGVKPIPALTGTQEYFQYFAGPLTCTVKLTFVEQTGSPYLTSFLTAQKQSLDVTIFDISTGDALNLHTTKAIYTTGDLDRSKEWVEVPVDVQLLPSTTDATDGGVSPVAITIANSVTTQYAA